MKTFEQFNELDPYGEENWDSDIQLFDFSNENLDIQVEELKRLLKIDDPLKYEEHVVEFHYSHCRIENPDGNDSEFEGVDNEIITTIIEDIFLEEDGEIIFVGNVPMYNNKKHDLENCNIYYAIDTNYHIFTKKLEIIL